MKKTTFYVAPIVFSFLWLFKKHNTFDPISLKGTNFLQFYLILLTGIYASILVSKFFNKDCANVEFYFLISILFLGIIKFIRGMYLGKAVGYLVMILIVEIVVLMFFKPYCIKNNKNDL